MTGESDGVYWVSWVSVRDVLIWVWFRWWVCLCSYFINGVYCFTESDFHELKLFKLSDP